MVEEVDHPIFSWYGILHDTLTQPLKSAELLLPKKRRGGGGSISGRHWQLHSLGI